MPEEAPPARPEPPRPVPLVTDGPGVIVADADGSVVVVGIGEDG